MILLTDSFSNLRATRGRVGGVEQRGGHRGRTDVLSGYYHQCRRGRAVQQESCALAGVARRWQRRGLEQWIITICDVTVSRTLDDHYETSETPDPNP